VVIAAATTITAAPSAARKRKGVVIRDPEETATPSIIVHSEPKSKDKGKGILVKRKEKQDNAVLRYQALKRKPQTKAQARKNMMQAAKKQKLDEEVEELKTHLQIVPNDEDDVYTEATPLALKVPVVDYQIHTENNKPHYKIIRADGTHQLFLSFISLLRNFDKEDLEILWQIVEEIFASSQSRNFSDDFLLNTLKAMFEKPNVEAHIWKNQRGNYGLAKKEIDDKIKEGTLKVDHGTDAMIVVLGKEKGGYARGVGSGVTYKRYFDLPRSRKASDERILLLQSQLDNKRRERQEKELLIQNLSNKMSQTEGMVTKLKNQLAA
nr:hypothetical protein [Tanacetum cinerariifolium]